MKKAAGAFKELLIFLSAVIMVMGVMLSSVVSAGEIDTPANAVRLNGITYELNYEDAEASVCHCTAGGNLNIRSCIKVNGKSFKVTQISDKAFYKNKRIQSVVIPSGITYIGKRAFYGCSNLTALTIKSKKITVVGKAAFMGMGKDCKIKIPASKKALYGRFIGKNRVF